LLSPKRLGRLKQLQISAARSAEMIAELRLINKLCRHKIAEK
jgi:hypothetical protein